MNQRKDNFLWWLGAAVLGLFLLGYCGIVKTGGDGCEVVYNGRSNPTEC